MNTTTSRAEHLAFAKARALEYPDAASALASITSDLNKHPETAGHSGIELGLMLAMTGNLDTPAQVRDFIEGFN